MNNPYFESFDAMILQAEAKIANEVTPIIRRVMTRAADDKAEELVWINAESAQAMFLGEAMRHYPERHSETVRRVKVAIAAMVATLLNEYSNARRTVH
jgi:hypothetical protein